MAKSPSITILERDMSAYTVTSSDTILAIVGYATKGPIGEPTLVTSRAEFNEKFGTAVIGSPYAALAAYRAFNQGNKVVFDRVAVEADTDAEEPTRAKEGEVVSHNIVAASAGTMGLDLGTPTTITGLANSEDYGVSLTIDGGTTVQTASTSDGTGNMLVADLLDDINDALTIEGTGAIAVLATNIITVTSGTMGITSTVSITSGTTATNDLIGSATPAIVTVPAVGGTESGTGTDNVGMKAREKGSSTNLISVVKSSRINPVTTELVHKIEVFYDGVLKETFDYVSLTLADPEYFLDRVNETPDNGGSKFITFSVEENDDPLEVAFNDGSFVFGVGETPKTDASTTLSDYDHVVGADGFNPDSAAKDSNELLFTEQLMTTGDLGNTEAFDFHILITPDMPEVSVQDAAIELAEFRQDFMYIVDPPYSYTYSEVADWHNGIGGLGRTTALGSSYSAIYWSWLKDYNTDAKEYVWCPPSIFIAEKFMEVDRVYGPWFAPAGDLRGRLNASDYESSPSFSQRETLYGDFNAVNPIVNFVSKGLEIYGQKTLIRENTSLNRINVRRMIIFAKKLIKKALEAILFEPHNPDSWRKASNLITAILEPIRQAGGIDQYIVIVDDTVNTPDVIAQNIMKGTIKIIPTNTIEIVEITMQVNKAGTSLTE